MHQQVIWPRSDALPAYACCCSIITFMRDRCVTPAAWAFVLSPRPTQHRRRAYGACRHCHAAAVATASGLWTRSSALLEPHALPCRRAASAACASCGSAAKLDADGHGIASQIAWSTTGADPLMWLRPGALPVQATTLADLICLLVLGSWQCRWHAADTVVSAGE